jgi:ribosomal protein L40E
MELTFACPSCGTVGQVASVESVGRAVCRRCGTDRPLHPEGIDGSRLDACPWCLTTDLYIQKDFPQALGLLIVMLQIGISTVFWYYEKPIETFAVLLGFTLLDWALYPRVPDVTICYRCGCQIRGGGSDGDGRFHPFDQAIGERYRQERIRAQELRERGASSD